MTASDAGRVRIPGKAWFILLLMTLDYVLATIDRNNVSILKTTLKAHFALTDADYSLLVSAFLVPYALFYVICGRLVDRYGSRRTFTAFVIVWSLATILSGLARSFPELLTMRLVLGAAEAGLLPATIHALVRWFPRDKLATVYAIKNPLQALGPILSPPLIAYLALGLGWRWAFVIPGLIGLVGGVLWWICDRDPPDYGDTPVGDEPDHPGLWTMLRTPALLGILSARLITDPVYFFFQNWQAGYLQEVLGFSLAKVGSLLWIPAFVNMAAVFVTALLSDRLVRRGMPAAESRLTMIVALSLLAPSIALLPVVTSDIGTIVLLTLAYIVGFGWLYLSNIMMADLFPRSQVATAIGLVNCVGTTGAAAFNALVGGFLEIRGYAPVFYFLALLYPAGAIILWLRYGRRSNGTAQPGTGAGNANRAPSSGVRAAASGSSMEVT